MNDSNKLKSLLESEEAYNIETNGNFMGTRKLLAEYLIKNGIGYIANIQNEKETIEKENELLKFQLKTVIAELNEMKRIYHNAPRRASFKIYKRKL